MARKDKPYLPLYVQDVLTDEKLIECSAEAHGVYLLLMCILHKQDKYGLLCLKQKYKQTEGKLASFARMLCKQMPFEQKIIQDGLQELLDEGVITMKDDTLFQKRMVADGELSLMRADIGKTGGSNVTKQYGKPGFLYWIGDGHDKNKIGVSVNVINRLYRLRSDLKLKKLKIQTKIKVYDMGKAEDFALLFFKEKRDGEWVKIQHSEMNIQFALLKANLQANDLANHQANADIEIDNENESEDANEFEEEGVGEDLKAQKKNSNNMSSIKDTEGIPLPFKSPEFELIWKEWLQNRKEARIKNYTPTGLKRLFKWLSETSGGDENIAIQIIEQSLTKGWQGLFELKQTINGKVNQGNTQKPTPAGNVAPGGFGQF